MRLDDDNSYQPDIQVICEKFGLGRHEIIDILAKLCRLVDCSPKELLVRLENVDNLDDYILLHSYNKHQVDIEDGMFD